MEIVFRYSVWGEMVGSEDEAQIAGYKWGRDSDGPYISGDDIDISFELQEEN